MNFFTKSLITILCIVVIIIIEKIKRSVYRGEIPNNSINSKLFVIQGMALSVLFYIMFGDFPNTFIYIVIFVSLYINFLINTFKIKK